MQQDNDFLLRLRDGDEQAFNAFYKHFKVRLLRFTLSYVRDREIAENLVHDCFSSFWQKRDLLAEDTNLASYMLKLTKNAALNFLTKEKNRLKAEKNILGHANRELLWRIGDLERFNPDRIFDREIALIFNKAIEKLPEQTRKILLMSRQEYKSHKEIAEILKISIKGVEFHITKALKLLRVEFSDYLLLLLLIKMIY